MWQTVIAVVIVAAAAAWVGRRFYRSLRGRGPACCGGDAPSGGSCAGCGPTPPQALETLAKPEACPHCQPQSPAGPGQTPPAGPPKDEQ